MEGKTLESRVLANFSGEREGGGGSSDAAVKLE